MPLTDLRKPSDAPRGPSGALRTATVLTTIAAVSGGTLLVQQDRLPWSAPGGSRAAAPPAEGPDDVGLAASALIGHSAAQASAHSERLRTAPAGAGVSLELADVRRKHGAEQEAAGLRTMAAVRARARAEAAARARAEARALAVAQARVQARAERAAAERAARRQQAARASRVTTRDPRGAARAMVSARGWGSGQFACLDALWQKESGWNHRARNPSSGAYGIPQSLPAGKMASAGADWRTNPVTQIRWGLDYIADRYGSPCGAWRHSQAHNWY